MMLEHLGETTAAAAIVAAFESVLAEGGDALTRDMGGTASTESAGTAVTDRLRVVAGQLAGVAH
jgi:tartrate dehydrogenase/decarboxylase/D-malate dehydrogenase